MVRMEVRSGIIQYNGKRHVRLTNACQTDGEEKLFSGRTTQLANPVIGRIFPKCSEIKSLNVAIKLDPIVFLGYLTEDLARVVDAYHTFDAESRKEVLLLSNDFGFIDVAKDAGLRAQHVDFPQFLPDRSTATWDDIGSLLYHLAIRFEVIRLPGVTVYGLWNEKDGRHWQNEELVIEARSPKVAPLLERDRTIANAFDAG